MGKWVRKHEERTSTPVVHEATICKPWGIDHNTKDDNKNIKMLKEELWTRTNTEVKVIVLQRNQVVKETILLDEIWRNSTRKQEVQKELEKEVGQVWENNRVVYMEERIYVLNNWKNKSRSYKTTMNQ